MCAESVAHVSPHVRGSMLGGRFILWGVVQMWHKRNHYNNQVKNMHFCHDVMIFHGPFENLPFRVWRFQINLTFVYGSDV